MSTPRISAAPDCLIWMLPPTKEPGETFTRAAVPTVWILPSTRTELANRRALLSTVILPSTLVPLRVQVAPGGT